MKYGMLFFLFLTPSVFAMEPEEQQPNELPDQLAQLREQNRELTQKLDQLTQAHVQQLFESRLAVSLFAQIHSVEVGELSQLKAVMGHTFLHLDTHHENNDERVRAIHRMVEDLHDRFIPRPGAEVEDSRNWPKLFGIFGFTLAVSILGYTGSKLMKYYGHLAKAKVNCVNVCEGYAGAEECAGACEHICSYVVNYFIGLQK